MRFTPTMEQVARAARQLPNPYHAHQDGREYYRVAVLDDMPYVVAGVRDLEPSVACHALTFELDQCRDPNGSRWFRWIYKGPVVV